MSCCTKCANAVFSSEYNFEREIRLYLQSGDYKGVLDTYERHFMEDNLEHIGNGFGIRSYKNHLICFNMILNQHFQSNCGSFNNKLYKLTYEIINDIERCSLKEEIINLGKTIIKKYWTFNSSMNLKCNNQIVCKATDYIHENFHKDLSLEEVADSIHVNKNYLSTMFVKCLDKKFKDYINYIKIDKAKNLLITSDKSLGEISYLCGFKTQNYFSTAFKKSEGTSPLSYRKGNSINML